MSIQITMLLFVTITLLAASAIDAYSTRRYDYDTKEDNYPGDAATTELPTPRLMYETPSSPEGPSYTPRNEDDYYPGITVSPGNSRPTNEDSGTTASPGYPKPRLDMSKRDCFNVRMSKIPDMTHDNYTLIEKKQIILNTFSVLSCLIEQNVNTDQPDSEEMLEIFKGNSTMQDLICIAIVEDSVPFRGTTDITNSGHKEIEKHEQKVLRKTYTYTEEEIVTQ